MVERLLNSWGLIQDLSPFPEQRKTFLAGHPWLWFNGPMSPPRSKFFLALEFCALFLLLPLALYGLNSHLRRFILPLILGAAGLATIYLRGDLTFSPERWGHSKALRVNLPGILRRFVLGGLVLTLGVSQTLPGDIFHLPRSAPVLWLAILLLYPLLSAFPQEIIFRGFFFQRYQGLFKTDRRMIWSSALAFGWAHLILGRWESVVLSTIAGLLFSWTYARSRSLWTVTLEHGLWGDLAFTIGLGRYFYGGWTGG